MPQESASFETVQELQEHHKVANLEAGRRLLQRQRHCADRSYRALYEGLAVGLVLSYGTMRWLYKSKKYALLNHHHGRGLVAGGLASMAAFGWSKYVYDDCLGDFMRQMRLMAEYRHGHYFQQLMEAPPDLQQQK